MQPALKQLATECPAVQCKSTQQAAAGESMKVQAERAVNCLSALAWVIAFSGLTLTSAAGKSPTEWRSRTIYQILTDRFVSLAGQGKAAARWPYTWG